MASRSGTTGNRITAIRSLYERQGDAAAFDSWLSIFESRLEMGSSLPNPPNPTLVILGDWESFANSYLETATLDDIQNLEEWKANVRGVYGDVPSELAPPPIEIPFDEPEPPGPFTILNSVLTGNLWITAAYVIARAALGTRTVASGTRILWTTLPGWARTGLIALGIAEGTNILIERAIDPDEGTALATIADLVPDILPFLHDEPVFGPIAPGVTPMPTPGHRGLSGELVSVGTVVTLGKRTHQIASYWFANGVYFYRFTDGWIGQRTKFGVWKARYPRGGVVLNKVGGNDSANILAALTIIEKEVKTAKRVLKAVGLKAVRRKSDD